MENFVASIILRNQLRELKSDSLENFIDFLENTIHSISSSESIVCKFIKFKNHVIPCLQDTILSQKEIIALKNHLKTQDEIGQYKVFGALACSNHAEICDLVETLDDILPKIKGVEISTSDLAAKDQHYSKQKLILVDNMENNPLLAPLIELVDWRKARSEYFSKVKMDYFGEAVLFIEKF